jgi:hypothetical protein
LLQRGAGDKPEQKQTMNLDWVPVFLEGVVVIVVVASTTYPNKINGTNITRTMVPLILFG